MEEWEEKLEAELLEIIERYQSEGLTRRQVLGTIEDIKLSNFTEVILFEPEEEE